MFALLARCSALHPGDLYPGVRGSMCDMVIDEPTLATIVTRLTEAASPARIILFGGIAYPASRYGIVLYEAA